MHQGHLARTLRSWTTETVGQLWTRSAWELRYSSGSQPNACAELCEVAEDPAIQLAGIARQSTRRSMGLGAIPPLAVRIAPIDSDLRSCKLGAVSRMACWGAHRPHAGPAAMLSRGRQGKVGDRAERQVRTSCPVRVTAAIDGTGENEHILVRGNPRILGEEAPRQLLTALVGNTPPIQHGSRPLDARATGRRSNEPANRPRPGQSRMAPPVRRGIVPRGR